MKKMLIAGVVLAATLIMGCGSSSPVGVYEFDKDHFSKEMTRIESEAKDEMEKAGIALGRAFAESLFASMEFELKEDGTMKMTAMGMPVEGTYTVNGDTVTFVMPGGDQSAGMNTWKYNKMKGTMTAVEDSDGQRMEIQFKRKKA